MAFSTLTAPRFPLSAMCRVLEFPERTFYAAKARPTSARAIADVDRKTLIKVEWKANYPCYGARGMSCTVLIKRGSPMRQQANCWNAALSVRTAGRGAGSG